MRRKAKVEVQGHVVFYLQPFYLRVLRVDNQLVRFAKQFQWKDINAQNQFRAPGDISHLRVEVQCWCVVVNRRKSLIIDRRSQIAANVSRRPVLEEDLS